MAKGKRIQKSKGRERIYGFSWMTKSGYRQAIYESDCDSRDGFLKERRLFLKNGIKIKDLKTRKPYRGN